MKNFADIKNSRMFVVLSILKGGTTRHKLTGIFYTFLIYGFVTPCGALMRPLPRVGEGQREVRNHYTTVSTPVWSVNAPTAFEVDSNGKAEPFLFSAKQTNSTVMLSTEKNLQGVNNNNPSAKPEPESLKKNNQNFVLEKNSSTFVLIQDQGISTNGESGYFYILLTTLTYKIGLFKSHVSRFFSKLTVPWSELRGEQSFLFNYSKIC